MRLRAAQSPCRDRGQVAGDVRSHGVGATRRRLVFLCGLVPVSITAVLAVYRPAFFARLDDAVYDIAAAIGRHAAARQRVVIVDVDERSLSTLGQWPWRRDVVGRLIARLRDMGASTIALDIIFAESDRSRSAGTPRRSTGSAATTPDDCWPACSATGRVVLGYGLTFDRPRARAAAPACCTRSASPSFIRRRGNRRRAVLSRDRRRVQPADARAGGGRFRFPERAPRFGRHSQTRAAGRRARRPRLSGLALAAVAAATGARDIDASGRRTSTPPSLTIDDRTVPLDGKSNLLVRYRGQEADVPLCVGGRRAERRRSPDGHAARTRSCSSARRRSARAKWWRRRSTRCLPASKCRRRSPTTCCSRTSSAGRRSDRCSTACVVLVLGLAVGGARRQDGRHRRRARRRREHRGSLVGRGVAALDAGLFISPLFPTLGVSPRSPS